MTSSDDNQERELLERYGQASRADPRAPSAAVRTAILDEARRVAASLAASAVGVEPEHARVSRWKMTAWGTAAAALLAALIIAPRLWDQAPPVHVAAISPPVIPFNQAAKKTESFVVAAEPRPVVPVMPVPGPRSESIAPQALAAAPTLRRATPPPPAVHFPEQSVEVTAITHTTQSAAAKSERQTQSGIDAYDVTGRTPLMAAVGQNQIDVVRLLLARGADPNATDQHGLTPLQLAQQSHFSDVATLLIEAGAR